MRTNEHDLDPRLLVIAAHELGHAIGHRSAGLRSTLIKVHKDWLGSCYGRVQVERVPLPKLEGYLVGVWAGEAADRMWCEQHGIRGRGESMSSEDYEIWQTDRQYVPKLTEAKAKARARRVVLDNWSEIVALAPVLAAQGTISL